MFQGRENVSDGPTRPSHDPPPPQDPPPSWLAVDSELQKAINTRKASRSKIGATDAIMQGALEGDAIEIGESSMEAQGVTVGHETDPPIDAPNFVAAFRNLVLCGIKTNIALSFTPVRGPRCVSQSVLQPPSLRALSHFRSCASARVCLLHPHLPPSCVLLSCPRTARYLAGSVVLLDKVADILLRPGL